MWSAEVLLRPEKTNPFSTMGKKYKNMAISVGVRRKGRPRGLAPVHQTTADKQDSHSYRRQPPMMTGGRPDALAAAQLRVEREPVSGLRHFLGKGLDHPCHCLSISHRAWM